MSIAATILPAQAQQIIYNTLRGIGLTDAASKIITAQSGHETNGWTSNVWKTYNNGFGFGWDGHSYNGYNNFEDSVFALVGWIGGRQAAGTFPDLSEITDGDQYAQLLKDNRYYEDKESNYAAGLQRWYNNNLSLVGGLSAAALVGLVVLFFVVVKSKK